MRKVLGQLTDQHYIPLPFDEALNRAVRYQVKASGNMRGRYMVVE
jgi:hypothetical protein